ncbi:carboxymuconolactone decarboxylase family protein [Nocardioides rubriscoriae]|uniref:carboxymuconolactone decarboxylase family protein n=1 Tax=Nocardioides rubriscoriae TaxID=642762 RepID=UPI0011DF1A21|nr:carboxymuconolactone decarboxylase family protein [Nocardioides rubriscoriae]
MARIPVHTIESAPEQSRDELKALEAKFGKVLNIHGEMAHSPVVLQSYVAVQQVIADYGTFDARTREAIALAVGNADGCSYCQAAHTGGGKAAGLSNDEMIGIRRGDAGFDAKLDALLVLARQYTTNIGTVDDAAWQAALDAGWTDDQLTELSAHVTLNLLTNFFNHFVKTDLDLPAAPAL